MVKATNGTGDPANDGLYTLLAAGARGCDKSFAALHAATKTRLRWILVRVVGPGVDVDDLLQEVYVKVWLSFEQFCESKGSVLTWMGAIARNVALDSFRRRQAQPHCVSASSDEDGLPYETIACGDPPQDLVIDRLRASRAVRQSVRSLAPGRRDLVTKAFYEGLSHSEISALSSLPLGTVKSQIRRSCEALRVPLALFAAF